MDNSADPAQNSLGLDLEALHLKGDPEPSGSPNSAEEDAASQPEEADSSNASEKSEEAPTEDEPKSPTSESKRAEGKDKKKPYVNPERVKTGGAQRDKPSEEELAERMARIREQNEKIKQRRVYVQADEEAFRKTQEADRLKAAKTKKVQETIDRTREQNARRKMDKIQTREWDSGKPSRDWKPTRKPDEGDEANKAPRASIGIRGATRGGGRGRGRTPSTTANDSKSNATVTEEPTAAPAPAAPVPATPAAAAS